ncbi:MAG: DUF896 domain-containing protein [Eubacteriales bacterium]|nr:DUF896 domain-containing protein [Eubacteriales bacterium]
MVKKEDINRLNELYKKSLTQYGLQDREKEEQALLRQLYIQTIRDKLGS